MNEFEKIKFPHKILIGNSPKEAEIAITSYSQPTYPGKLSQSVLEECGYSHDEFPSKFLVNNVYFYWQPDDRTPILFIKTVGDYNVNLMLEDNLRKALITHVNHISNKKVWIPLMGTGAGGLSLDESYAITIRVLNEIYDIYRHNIFFQISIPEGYKGELFYKKIFASLEENQSFNGPKILDSFESSRNFYLAGAYWSGADKTKDFIENGIWQNGHDDKYFDLVNEAKVDDIIFLKSTFQKNGISYLRVKAVGIIQFNPQNGEELKVDWIIGEILVDIDDLGYFRDAFIILKSDDVKIILDSLKENEINLDSFYNLNVKDIVESTKNKLKQVTLNNDGAQAENDVLGFENDIRAFAPLIALKELQPPLAIALFGKWGTGKSFFMYNLQKRIQELSTNQGFKEQVPTRKDDINNNKPFCEGVVHITFNAWSYTDANLWASLAINIFEKLDEYIRDYGKAGGEKKAIRKILGEKLSIINSEKEELVKDRVKLQRESDGLIKEINTLEEKRKREEAGLIDNKIEQLYSDVEKKIPLDNYIQQELKKYGIEPDDFKGLSKDELWAEVTSWVRFVKTVFTFNTGNKILMFSMAIILILAYANPRNLMEDFLPFLHNKIVAFFTIIGPLLIAIQQTWKKLQKVYEPIKAYKNNFNKSFNDLKNTYENNKNKLTDDLQKKTTELLAKNAQIESLDNEIKTFEIVGEENITRKAFVSFIERKAVDEEYKKALSIVNTIRRDFEVLSDLFGEYSIPVQLNDNDRQEFLQKKSEAEELKKLFQEGKHLDRIVLYIDDLDRCPEERVIEVLEAVNLLMAFRLFVVVVGVDPRWVKNSLIKKYTLQFTGLLNNVEKMEKYGIQPINVSDYLEKIFQIPFHLNEAQSNGVSALLDSVFAGQILKEENNKEKKIYSTTISFSDEFTEKLHRDNAVFETQQISTDELIHFRPEDLKISNQELQDLKDLSWLVGNNPRSIKRYANMYRIIRAHEALSYSVNTQRKDFLTVIFILGFSIGEHKNVAPFFFNACNMNPESDLISLLDSEKDEECKAFQKKLKAKNLPESLKTILAKDFNKYIPFVKRFSFENSM